MEYTISFIYDIEVQPFQINVPEMVVTQKDAVVSLLKAPLYSEHPASMGLFVYNKCYMNGMICTYIVKSECRIPLRTMTFIYKPRFHYT